MKRFKMVALTVYDDRKQKQLKNCITLLVVGGR